MHSVKFSADEVGAKVVVAIHTVLVLRVLARLECELLRHLHRNVKLIRLSPVYHMVWAR